MRDALLVPRAALPYLDVAVPAGTHHAELAPLRREALDVLAAGYRGTGRTLLGVLAWAATAGGATLLAVLPWLGASAVRTAALAVLGALLLAGGGWLTAGVLRSGRRITGAAAAWLRVPAAGATDTDASGLLGVVRWRVVLAAVAAAVAVALSVTLVYVLARTGTLGAASFGAGTTTAVPDLTRAALVAALAIAALTTAGVAAGTFAGVRTVVEAAWRRPTVASAVRAPAAPPETFAPRSAYHPGPSPRHQGRQADGVQRGPSPRDQGRQPDGVQAAPSPREQGRQPDAPQPGPSPRDPARQPDGPAPSPAPDPGLQPGWLHRGPSPREEDRQADGSQPDGPPTVALDLTGLQARVAAVPDHAAPQPKPGMRVEVLLPDGRSLREGSTLVGRRPQARPEDVVDDVVVLTDQTVTKTHAAITIEGSTVSVVDRASTNGTLLEAPDGSLVRCRPWQVTTVRAPAIIHLGRTRLHVRPAAAHRPLEVA